MKSIKKITKTVAGSALLVGATLAGASAMGAAQSSGSSGNTLGDYPAPFVDEDGTVDGTTVVVGNSAKTADVLGATNVAAALGNAAFTSEMVSASGGSFGWSAMNGVTLDTQNDQLYFGDSLDSVRQTLTDDNLETLSETTFTDDSNEDTDVTNFLDIGNQQVTFGNSPDGLDNEDPVVHVPVPTESTVSSTEGDYLFNLQANFEESLDFTNEDVAGEEIELFGMTYTIAEENTDGDDDELVLFGGQESVSISTDEEAQTITVNGNEVTLSVDAVTGSDTAAITVNGELEEYNEDEEFSVEGEEVRVDNIIQTSNDQSAGTVTFAIGSQEIVLQNGQQIQDGDGDDIEGSYVEFDGGATSNISSISSIDLYVGAEDDDMDYLAAGDSFMHSALPGVEVHFGGLNPDVKESDDSTSIEFGTQGDDTATISYTTDEGDESTFGFAYKAPTPANGDLADEDGDEVNVFEGNRVTEDEYFTADAGDFSRMFEVTDINRDGEDSTVDLREVASGDSMEVELDDGGNTTPFRGREIINGQKYYFDLNSTGLMVTWGDGSDYADVGDRYSLYPALDTQGGGAVAPNQHGFGSLLDAPASGTATQVFELPTTESTDAATVNLSINSTGAITLNDASSGVKEITATQATEDLVYDENIVVEVNGGYRVLFHNADQELLRNTSSTDEADLQTHIMGTDQKPANGNNFAPRSMLVLEPENDDDEEQAYVVGPGYDTDENEVTYRADNGVVSPSLNTTGTPKVGSTNFRVDEDGSGVDVIGTTAKLGQIAYPSSAQKSDLESDDDVTASYDEYGAYTEVDGDSDSQGSFQIWMPNGQAVVGAAVTGADGSLDMGGSSGSVSSMMPTYNGMGFPASDFVALDNENPGDLKQNDLILVGGPAVNNLVSELAEANKTWTGDQYEEGDQVVDLVNDAFNEDQDALVVAGYNAGDTRAAARSVANWKEWPDSVSDMQTVNLATQ